jgi:hypothetical protein
MQMLPCRTEKEKAIANAWKVDKTLLSISVMVINRRKQMLWKVFIELS